jgi:hypothetical protein
MKFTEKSLMIVAVTLSILFLSNSDNAQNAPLDSSRQNPVAVVAESKKSNDSNDYRQLQSDEFLVDTAYLQDEGEFLHKFAFARSNRGKWSTVFTEEVTLGSEKHQVVFSLPARLAGNVVERSRGLGDGEIEYFYGLYGNSSTRVTVSPGVGVSFPLGSPRKEMGAGGVGLSFKLPVSIALTNRFASNSLVGMTYTKSARNSDGDRADSLNYELGQSFVWFAKPRFNIFVEALFERSQEVTGSRLTKNEYSVLISPAIRWTHEFKNGLSVSPGIAVPVGVGPSRGERNIFFYITFGHPIKKRDTKQNED